MAPTDPRTAAFSLLRRVEREGAYSSLLLQHLEDELHDPRDRSLAHELVLGVLRRARSLDAVIDAFSSRPPDRVDADVRLVLRLGLYQILFLDRIPVHAAVHESVRLIRALAGASRGADRFVNAVLRGVLRDRDRALTTARGGGQEDPIDALAVGTSHPRWLVARYVERFGIGGAGALLEAQNRPAPLSARVVAGSAGVRQALAALAAESLPAVPSPLLDDFIRVEGAAQRSALFRSGGLYIQDEASGLVARLAGVRSGDRVLDACAAPGGKSLAMASRAAPDGWVVAADRHPGRVALVAANAARVSTRLVPLAADLSTGDPFREGTRFDVVVVDAPCSGTGVIRRSPELRERVNTGFLDRLTHLQEDLLSSAARLVRPGGTLVYSVCSLEPEEGEDRVAPFLAGHRFEVEDPRPHLPSEAAGMVDSPAGFPALRTRPDRDGLDGFFAVRLRRTGQES